MQFINKQFSIVLCCIFNTVVVEMACETYVPSLPVIKNFFNTTESTVEFVVAAYLIGLSLSGIVFGPISDITGRKKVLICGSILFFAASIFSYACYYIPTISSLIAANFLQGIGGGAAMITSFAGVRDRYSGKDLSSILTKLNISISIAPALGPIIGSIIVYYYSWHFIFLFLSCVSLLALIININTEETNFKPVKKDGALSHIYHSYKDLMKNKTFVLFTMMQVMTLSTIWGEVSNLPFIYIQDMHVNNIAYGCIMMMAIVMYIIGAFLNQKYVDQIGRKTMIHFGVALTITFDCLIIFSHYTVGLDALLLTALKMPVSFALPFVTINCSTIALNSVKKNKGTATAFLESAQTIGGAVYIYILSIFYNSTMVPMCISSLIVFTVIFILHFIVSYKNSKVHVLIAD